MLEFMKLYADMEQLFEPFTQEEKGNLLDAMMAYCFRGEEPSFSGNERYIWAVLRRHFDQCAERAETLRANAAKGGRPRKQKESEESKPEAEETKNKPNETKENQEKQNETKKKLEQEQEQEHIQEHKQEQYNAPAPATDDKVIAFDGSDLTQASADNEQAQRLVARYMPAGRTPVEFDPRVADISDLIAQYGLKKVEDAMKEAMRSDNRGGVSINFIKAILENKGSKSRAAPGGDYLKRQYDDDYWKSIEQTFDDAI